MYTISEINREFLIKVAGRDESNNKLNTLVGVSGLARVIGEKFATRFIDRAMESLEDVCTFKLRRGIKVSFYRH